MVGGFDNIHLQQHLVDKLQEQLSEEAAPQSAAKPEDVAKFKAHINGGEAAAMHAETASPISAPPVAETAGSERVGRPLSATASSTSSRTASLTPGEQILDKMAGMHQGIEPIDSAVAAQATPALDVSETLQLQLRVAELSAQEGVMVSTSGKASKDTESLLKTQ